MNADSTKTGEAAEKTEAVVIKSPKTAKSDPPAAAREGKKRPRQFRPGQEVMDSYKRRYWADQNGSLRRLDGGKLSKAAKKAAKRQRRAPQQARP